MATKRVPVRLAAQARSSPIAGLTRGGAETRVCLGTARDWAITGRHLQRRSRRRERPRTGSCPCRDRASSRSPALVPLQSLAAGSKHPMRAYGDEQVRLDSRVETHIRPRAGMGGGHGFVTACVRNQQRDRRRGGCCSGACNLSGTWLAPDASSSAVERSWSPCSLSARCRARNQSAWGPAKERRQGRSVSCEDSNVDGSGTLA